MKRVRYAAILKGDANMKRVESMGLFHYEIAGEREAEAAAALEQKLNAIYRGYSTDILDDISAARHSVVEQYGVEIRAVVG